MPIPTVTQKLQAYCHNKLQNRFPVKNGGKISVMNVNRFSASGAPLYIENPHILAKLPKQFFCDLKNKLPSNLNINSCGSTLHEDLRIETTLSPVKSRWTIPLNITKIQKLTNPYRRASLRQNY